MIRLYHGTNVLFDRPDLSKCNPNKDFGRGFYLTPDLASAKRMAERCNERDGWAGGPRYVLTYLLNENDLSRLAVRRFSNPLNEECARFVIANRRPRTPAADHNQYLIRKEHLSEKEALARVYSSDFYSRLSNRKSGLFGESQASLIHLFSLSQEKAR